MKVSKTKFKDLLIFSGETHKDKRGFLRELYFQKLIKKKFKFVLTSMSKKNVLRGLHYQTNKPQGKYVFVAKGKIFDVVVDIRKKSKTFGKSFSIILSNKNCKSIYIPAGFAHGFLTLDKENIVCYYCTEYRSKKHEFCLNYNDPFLKINWPKKRPILSTKDKNASKFKDLFN